MMIAIGYDVFNTNSGAGLWSALDRAVVESGASFYHLLFKAGVWIALLAIISSGAGIAWYGQNAQQLSLEKKRAVRVMICFMLFLSLLGLFSCFQGIIGLD